MAKKQKYRAITTVIKKKKKIHPTRDGTMFGDFMSRPPGGGIVGKYYAPKKKKKRVALRRGAGSDPAPSPPKKKKAVPKLSDSPYGAILGQRWHAPRSKRKKSAGTKYRYSQR